MDKIFIFESFYKNKDIASKLEVSIEVWSNGSDYGFDDLSISDSDDGNREIKLEDLPEVERVILMRQADSLAYESSSEAYQDYLESRADSIGQTER